MPAFSRRIALASLAAAVVAGGACQHTGVPTRPPRQAVPPPSPGTDLDARAARFIEMALAEGKAFRLLEELVSVAPHRLSGSEGLEVAVEWARRTMERLDLDNVRLQEVMVPHWVRGDVEEARVVGPGPEEKLAVMALGGSIATPAEGITAEVVEVRTFEELRDLGESARGKIVFFNRPMPPALFNPFAAYGATVGIRTRGAVEAARAGSVAALVRSVTLALDDHPHAGAMRYAEADGVPKVPAAALSTLASERLSALLRKEGRVTVRLRLSCRTLPDAKSANVIGEITGSERPEEIILIGAHIDSWDVGQGAHDDAAGCAHVLEAMRLIKAAGLRPRRTIRAVLFTNEENGLQGALAYEREHRDEMPHHKAAIESDRGGFQPIGFTTPATGRDFEALRRLVSPLEPYGMGSLLPGGGGADIGPLGPHGVTLIGFLPAMHRYFYLHHSDKDRIEEVNEREMALGAAAMAYLASALADA